MHICIFQTGEPLHIDSGNYRPMRAMLLADKLLEKGHKVTLISSCFFHQRKIFRSKDYTSIKVKKNLIIDLIPSCGYSKHISIRRLFDHLLLSINLHNYLKKKKGFHPDKIFIGYPPIETAFVLIRWANKLKIPIMLDVKDNWPENFIEPFSNKFKKLSRIFIFPYYQLTKYIFRNVNSICSITESFLIWIKSHNSNANLKKNLSDIDYFLAPLVRKRISLSKKQLKKSYDFWLKKGIKVNDQKHFSFVGSISNSFDFQLIMELANFLNQIYPDHFFIICGTGERFSEISTLFKSSPNIFLFGEVDKYNAALLISNSIATLAPYINNKNFQNSIPNKVIESLENSVPFITNTDGEMKNIIRKNNNGIFLEESKKFSEIIKLIEDKKYLNYLRKNALKSYKKLFSFEKTYENIIYKLLNI